jgi:hypothetical protein
MNGALPHRLERGAAAGEVGEEVADEHLAADADRGDARPTQAGERGLGDAGHELRGDGGVNGVPAQAQGVETGLDGDGAAPGDGAASHGERRGEDVVSAMMDLRALAVTASAPTRPAPHGVG